jgi:hypothetical protein
MKIGGGSWIIGLATSIVAMACSSGGADAPSGASSGASGSPPAADGGPGSGAVDAATSDGGIAAACNGDEGGPVPTTPDALYTWLQGGSYRCWAHESVQHPSTGPHTGDVQTYVNGALDASLQRGGEHPVGAVAVKEFFEPSGTARRGWAVLVKNQAASAGGDGFYWYELIGTSPSGTRYEGQGSRICTGCHAGGRDFVLAPYPLR